MNAGTVSLLAGIDLGGRHGRRCGDEVGHVLGLWLQAAIRTVRSVKPR
jgi:hypothetical protein